ncbi:GTP cyclohydrolase II [Ramlibacter sp.]|uniref:GTP cyclohydrolase II n=1 Tax=Ramlibacter sp. TaxID=1917967 RepID=UPI002FCC144C
MTAALQGRVRRMASARMPTAHGDFDMHVFRDAEGAEHAALVRGDVAGREDVPVRIHSECLTGDVFGSCRCDCGEQLQSALRHVAASRCGVVIYLRGHEGRGIGLANKIRAYGLQQCGRDTVEANTDLGLPVDARSYAAAAAILHELGLRSVALITNNPDKLAAMADLGVHVQGRIASAATANRHNAQYLRTKREKLGHLPAPG